MANEQHVKIVLAGKDAIEQWRKNFPGSKLYLAQADLRGADLRGADLNRVSLDGANLRGADLAEAYLTEAELSGADLNRVSLDGAILRGADLAEADLRGADLTRADLYQATLHGANLAQAQLLGATLSEAILSGANLAQAQLLGANLSGASLPEAILAEANLTPADLRGAHLFGANLTRAKLTGANLTRANLAQADLRGADLLGADLTEANLIGADIRGATVDSDTQFNDLKSVKGLHVDRSTVEYMFPDPLTRGPKMMDMRVVDDLATLRASFSGFSGWIYWLGFIAFLLPPVWFVCVQAGTTEAIRAANSWVRENPQFVLLIPGRTTHEPAVSTPAETITLLTAVGRYLYNGGRGWRDGWTLHCTFILFLVSLAYRIASFVLLADTVKQVNDQEFSGTPARFSFTQPFQCRILWVPKWTVQLGTYQSWYDWNRRLSFVVAAIAIGTLVYHLQMLIVVD